MPRKDPITGVQVMTSAEFWEMEADREGKGRMPGEVMMDFYLEWENEIEKEKANFMADPNRYLLPGLQQMIDEDIAYNIRDVLVDEDELEDTQKLYPVNRILLVGDLEYRQTFKETNLNYRAQVECKDGEIRWVRVHTWDYSGDFYNPPDSEVEIEFL